MTMEPLMGPIIRRRCMNCAPPPLRREPRMETDGSAAGEASILNFQISILPFRLGYFSIVPHYIAGGGKAGRNFSVSRGRRIHGTGRGGRTSSYDFCLSGASRINRVKREEERGKSRNETVEFLV